MRSGVASWKTGGAGKLRCSPKQQPSPLRLEVWLFEGLMIAVMVPDFATLIPMLDSASRTETTSHPFLIEALQRLEQLDWLCRKISELELKALYQMTPKFGEPYAGMSAVEVQLLTLTESFYYTAWRLIGLLDKEPQPIKKLNGIRRACPGIRTVRNHLIEHPEGANSRANIPAIAFGHGCGPQLKMIKEVITSEVGEVRFKTFGADLFDRGLWNNASELYEFIFNNLKNDAHQSGSL